MTNHNFCRFCFQNSSNFKESIFKGGFNSELVQPWPPGEGARRGSGYKFRSPRGMGPGGSAQGERPAARNYRSEPARFSLARFASLSHALQKECSAPQEQEGCPLGSCLGREVGLVSLVVISLFQDLQVMGDLARSLPYLAKDLTAVPENAA